MKLLWFKFIVGIFTILLVGTGHSATTKAVCFEMQKALESIQGQLPLSIDYATDLLGAQAIYIGDVCVVNFNYLVETRVFVQEMMKENGLTEAENVAWLRTDEGRSVFQGIADGIAADSIATSFNGIKSYKNMKLLYRYSFDEFSIPSFLAIGLDTTS